MGLKEQISRFNSFFHKENFPEGSNIDLFVSLPRIEEYREALHGSVESRFEFTTGLRRTQGLLPFTDEEFEGV